MKWNHNNKWISQKMENKTMGVSYFKKWKQGEGISNNTFIKRKNWN